MSDRRVIVAQGVENLGNGRERWWSRWDNGEETWQDVVATGGGSIQRYIGGSGRVPAGVRMVPNGGGAGGGLTDRNPFSESAVHVAPSPNPDHERVRIGVDLAEPGDEVVAVEVWRVGRGERT